MILSDTCDFDVAHILLQFCIEGDISDALPYGGGHINDSFHLKNRNPAFPDYLLQRINHNVFKNVPALMANIKTVTAYLDAKTIAGFNPYKTRLTLVPTRDNRLYYEDNKGNYWRIYIFIPESHSYDLVLTMEQAFEGGKAFGSFQSLLSDMDSQLLSETIADFHNIKKRLTDLYSAVSCDRQNRVSQVIAEIDNVKQQEPAMCMIYDWGEAGLLPKRITHNDTKFNNILFDADEKAICVIDLDTVMSGYVAYDFGDAIRTIINTALEDEPDLEKIQLNVSFFKAYTQGYISQASGFLTEKEIESLSLGMLLLPYMQGVRFLTDFLQGDTYFKTSYPGHNLVRAKAQFQLLKKLQENEKLLQEVIIETVAEIKVYSAKAP